MSRKLKNGVVFIKILLKFVLLSILSLNVSLRELITASKNDLRWILFALKPL